MNRELNWVTRKDSTFVDEVAEEADTDWEWAFGHQLRGFLLKPLFVGDFNVLVFSRERERDIATLMALSVADLKERMEMEYEFRSIESFVDLLRFN